MTAVALSICYGINLELLPVSEFALAIFVIRVASGFDALAGGILDFSHDRNALKVEHMAEEPRRPRPRESRGQFSNGAESYFAVRSCSRLATVASVGASPIQSGRSNHCYDFGNAKGSALE